MCFIDIGTCGLYALHGICDDDGCEWNVLNVDELPLPMLVDDIDPFVACVMIGTSSSLILASSVSRSAAVTFVCSVGLTLTRFASWSSSEISSILSVCEVDDDAREGRERSSLAVESARRRLSRFTEEEDEEEEEANEEVEENGSSTEVAAEEELANID